MDIYILHPMVVHFPIVLLLLGTLALWATLLGRPTERAAVWLLGLGALSSVVAVVSGLLAEEHAEELWHVPERVIETHEQLSIATMVAAIVTFALLAWGRHKGRRGLVKLAGVLSLVTCGLLVVGSDKGGDIVYKHAIPATAPAAAPAAPEH